MRMTKADWNFLHNFSEAEFGYPLLMDATLMHRLDVMRSWVGKPFVIHASYATEGHSTDSLHYEGKAVDGHFVGLTAIEQYMAAEQFNWGGLGFYPAWNNPGIHVDTRIIGATEKAARWWRNEKGVYHSIDLGIIKTIIEARFSSREGKFV